MSTGESNELATLERQRAIRRAVSITQHNSRDDEYRQRLAAQRSRVDMQIPSLDKADLSALASLSGIQITEYFMRLHRANLRQFLAESTPEQRQEFDILSDHFFGRYTGDRTMVDWLKENLE